MEVEILASRVSDNFYYGLTVDGAAALVDPVDGSGAVDWLRENGYELRYVFNTHFHRDHTGGNPTVMGAFPGADLVVSAGDAERIRAQLSDAQPGVDQTISGGDELELGDETIEVYDTPGHTRGHVSLMCGDHLFSGDTIFVGGAGNCNFGGEVGELFETFRGTITEFDDSVTFYPGHDYSVRDLEFIRSVEPDNERAESVLERARETPEDEIFLTTLGEERAYSPFFRWDDDDLQTQLQEEYTDTWDRCSARSRSDEEAVFRSVRALRDEW